MRTYRLHGVLFTEHEIKLLLTVKNLFEDGYNSETELNFSFDCSTRHINVLQRMACWCLGHKSDLNSCMTTLTSVLRTEGCVDFKDMCTVYRACEFFEFELLIKPMYTLLSNEVKHNPEAFLVLLKSCDDTQEFTEAEKEAHKKELQEMKRVIPPCQLFNGAVSLVSH